MKVGQEPMKIKIVYKKKIQEETSKIMRLSSFEISSHTWG